MRHRRLIGAVALAAGTALAFSACGSGSSSQSSGSGKQKTFTVWWYEDKGMPQDVAWTAALESFKASHPGVTVEVEHKDFHQMNDAGAMILNSDSVPDVLEYNKGNASAGLAASKGLLTDLSGQATARDWEKAMGGAATVGRYDEKGIMGSGPLYGIPSYGEFVSFFYNKDMFAKAGVDVPTSMAELEAVMARFKSQGVTPQCQAAGDYNATHLLWGLAAAKGGPEYLKKYFGLTAPLDTSASSPLRQAAQTIVDWTGKGYLDKKSTGLNTDAAWDLFLSGKCPMSYTGTWRVSSLQTRTGGFQWGQFLMPGSSRQVGSGGNLWVVPTKAKHKSLAYDWIELTLSKNVQTDMANKGGVAVAADVSAITDPVGKYENETFGKLSAEDGLALYGDWPVPNFYQVIQSSTQALVGGSQSVDQFLGNLKTAYDQFQSTLG